jgi:hypothetical protein
MVKLKKGLKMSFKMNVVTIEATLLEEMLGMSPDPNIYGEFIAKNAPDSKKMKEEMEALTKDLSPEEAAKIILDKGTTVFPRDEDGIPIMWDFQMKGNFKDVCGMLYRAEGTLSSKFTAYKKKIDGLIFVKPRKIRLLVPDGGKIGECQRPLRAQTARGEITALANSETVPAGTKLVFDIEYMDLKGKAPKIVKKGGKTVKDEDGNIVWTKSEMLETIKEWLNYGAYRGLGQWRNSGKGIYTYKIIEVNMCDENHWN